jgi:regulator of cell morphogenesis and NO signaling
MINIAEETLASIVTANHEVVPVLEKYNLDFCCKGKRTLAQACTEKGLPVDSIVTELTNAGKDRHLAAIPFAEMNAEQLIRHILLKHHFYVRQSMPAIEEHLTKVASKHGDRYPYMVKVLELFTHLKNEMYLHMQKEEVVLFPRINEIASLFHYNIKRDLLPGYIQGPVSVMESEHDEAGEILARIKTLTDNYTEPADACTTFKVCLAELKAFEEDLHKHVHLENNLLFPLAQKMQQAIINQ